MALALQAVARWFGAFAGFAGIEHGYFEIQQGDVAPPGLYFPSLGPPCDPDAVWHGCEPAITLLPDLLTAGIASVILGAITMIWALFFVERRYGGLVLASLSVALLVVGGGVVPPVIGLLGGLAAIRTPARASGEAGFRRILAALWPWSLVAFFTGLAAMVVAGQLSNELVTQYGLIVLVGIPSLMLLAVASAWARDSVGKQLKGTLRRRSR